MALLSLRSRRLRAFAVCVAVIVGLVGACRASVSSTPLVDLVDTRIGTGGHGFGVGSLNPGAQVPFGAMRLGPDTSLDGLILRWQHFGGYYYYDNSIDAFSHTHLVGAGVGDWGNVGVMVTRSISADIIKDNNYRSKFSHDGEIAQPGYYSVGLQTPNATAEVTVSGTLSGIHQYTLHGTTTNSDAFVVVDVCHTISKNACRNATVAASIEGDNGVVSGSVLTAGSLTGRSSAGGVWVYFYAIIPNAASSALWMNETLLADSVASAATTSGSLGAYVKLNTSRIEGSSDLVANVRIGISFISVGNAKNNLMAQQASGHGGSFTSFSDAKAAVQAQWEGMLGRVTVGTDSSTSSTDVAKFYGGIYRASLAPTTYTEANMQYLGFDFKVHTWTGPGQYHSDMSLWDIHRSQTPLLTLLAPDVSRDVVNSLLTMYQQGGHMPRWPLANVYTGCMVASHGIEVVTDAVMKGVQGINTTLAFEASYAASNGQDQQEQYTKYGYIPSEVDSHAASTTLAYAFDDWATSQLAGVIGKTPTQQEMLARSKNYRNIWSSEMFFCPKSEAGNITCPAVPEMPYPIEKDYTEGNAWQYLWFVPGDPEGLVALFPSVDKYVSRLNFFFAESLKWPLGTFMPNPYYWAGNEPDLLAAWQFNFAGNDYANYTQYWTRKMLDIKYSTTADGLPGNDDFGTMSAWEVWAYMGLYPLTGSRRFSIGAPAFPSVNVTLPASLAHETLGVEPSVDGAAGTTVLSVVAHGASPTAVYVRNATCNGVALASPFVTWDQLVNDGKGGVLEFWMDDAPHPWPTA